MALNEEETQLWVQETEIWLVLNAGSQSIVKVLVNNFNSIPCWLKKMDIIEADSKKSRYKPNIR